ncbi:MAG: 4Fe-4S binding protein [Peptoniphilus sp.]|nr:4Fe-4S binding protein [Peptoniphilus sp.]
MKDKKNSKISNFRTGFQILFTALTNGYALGFAKGKIYQGPVKNLCVPGLNCYSCPGALGSCPIGALQAVATSRDFNISFYVIGFLMIIGSLIGRFVCGWMCPFGLLQDLLHKIPFPKKIKTFKGERHLLKAKYLILLIFVLLLPITITVGGGYGKPWFCKVICPSGTLMGGIPLLLTNESLRKAAGLIFSWKVTVLLMIIFLSMVIHRPFCKYLCPLGAIYGGFNKISLYQYTVDEHKCIKCDQCYRQCSMNVKIYENATSAECIRCGECTKVCPTNAISTKFKK